MFRVCVLWISLVVMCVFFIVIYCSDFVNLGVCFIIWISVINNVGVRIKLDGW